MGTVSYTHLLGNYNVLSLQDNFTPETYMEAIGICEDAGMEVIIIDSISPVSYTHLPSNTLANATTLIVSWKTMKR